MMIGKRAAPGQFSLQTEVPEADVNGYENDEE